MALGVRSTTSELWEDTIQAVTEPIIEYLFAGEFLLKKNFFLMRTIFKVFIEFATILFLFYVLVFLTTEACGILVP